MRRTLLILASILVALIGGLGLWGAVLPREHHATSRATITAPPESVYAVIRDIGRLPAWWKDAQSVISVPGTDGWERWQEDINGFVLTLIVSEEEPGVRLVTTIDTTGNDGFGGTWRYETTISQGGATTVTITEAGWVKNPFFRVMMKLGGTHTTLDSYLTALGAKFGKTVTPTHVVP